MSAKELGAAKLQYPQFLHALMLLGDKRQTGFQEVVSRILHCVSAKPVASMADLLTFSNMGNCQVGDGPCPTSSAPRSDATQPF
jgi:hypothetical protein